MGSRKAKMPGKSSVQRLRVIKAIKSFSILIRFKDRMKAF